MPISRVAALLSICISVAAIKEPGSGIDFPKKSKLGTLQSFGLRKKGPIKVYAVGMYQDSFKSKGFMLKMAMGVGAPKMTTALVDALKPRCSDAKALDQFSDVMLAGLPDGCSKGMSLAFGTGGGKLSLSVNGKAVGAVASKPLAKAFANIYCDKNAVCALNPAEC